MNPRSETLTTAEKLINGDRNNHYGPPSQDFTRTARLWTTYLDGRTTVEAHDVAIMMILLKISRIRWSPEQHDHWIDIAGYAACGWDAYISSDKPSADDHEIWLRYEEMITELEDQVSDLEKKLNIFTGKTMRKTLPQKPGQDGTPEEWAKYYDDLPSMP